MFGGWNPEGGSERDFQVGCKPDSVLTLACTCSCCQLSLPTKVETAISLGRLLPTASCDLPGNRRRADVFHFGFHRQ